MSLARTEFFSLSYICCPSVFYLHKSVIYQPGIYLSKVKYVGKYDGKKDDDHDEIIEIIEWFVLFMISLLIRLKMG
jgi:hypothetical protein